MKNETRTQPAARKTRAQGERAGPFRIAAARRTTPEERQRMIAENAYYRAADRGFHGGDPIRDWLEAEAEIDARLVRATDEGEDRAGAER